MIHIRVTPVLIRKIITRKIEIVKVSPIVKQHLNATISSITPMVNPVGSKLCPCGCHKLTFFMVRHPICRLRKLRTARQVMCLARLLDNLACNLPNSKKIGDFHLRHPIIVANIALARPFTARISCSLHRGSL